MSLKVRSVLVLVVGTVLGLTVSLGSSLLGDCEHVYLCIQVRYKHAVTTNNDRNFI